MGATIKDLKDAGIMVPTTSPLTLLSVQCRRQMGRHISAHQKVASVEEFSDQVDSMTHDMDN